MMEKLLHDRQKRVTVMDSFLSDLFPDIALIPLTYQTPWELLVAVILSAQCTDVQVNKVTAKLFKKYPKLSDYEKADLKEFEKDIYSTGFYKTKTRNILAAARVIQEEYGGTLPQTMEELVAIPGVGRKTANVILGHLFGIVEGVVVDTHVMRLAQKFDLTDFDTPEKVEMDLMTVLSKELWWSFALRLKLYGQEYSKARDVAYDDPMSLHLKAKKMLPELG